MEGMKKICLDLSRGKFYQFFFSTARETRLQNKEKRKQRHRKKEKRKRVFLVSTKEKQFPFSPQLLFMIFLLSVRRPQSPSGAHIGCGICFDFPSTLKLFAFMINYRIPLTFYIFYSWNIYPTRIFPSHHSPFNGNFRIFSRRTAIHFLPSTFFARRSRAEECENIFRNRATFQYNQIAFSESDTQWAHLHLWNE